MRRESQNFALDKFIADHSFTDFINQIGFDASNLHGRKPINLATELNKIGVVEDLLLFGANPNLLDSSGNAPIHIATENNNLYLLKILAKKANLVQENLAGETALLIASRSCNIAIIEFLLSLNPQLNFATDGKNVLFALIMFATTPTNIERNESKHSESRALLHELTNLAFYTQMPKQMDIPAVSESENFILSDHKILELKSSLKSIIIQILKTNIIGNIDDYEFLLSDAQDINLHVIFIINHSLEKHPQFHSFD
jgi:ankyrin repeat protein